MNSVNGKISLTSKVCGFTNALQSYKINQKDNIYLYKVVNKMVGFGERLRKLRRDADVTQKQLAIYLGIKGAAVGKWETIENAYPNTDTLIKIAEYFNVSIDYLLRGIQTVPIAEGNVIGSSLSASVVQTNVQTHVHGDMVVNGRTFSPEAVALAQIYERVDVRSRNELLTLAFKLEDKALDRQKS